MGWVGSLLMSLTIFGHVIRRILLGQKLGVILMTILRQKLSRDGILIILGISGRVPWRITLGYQLGGARWVSRRILGRLLGRAAGWG